MAVSQAEGGQEGTGEEPASTDEGSGASTGGNIPPLECDPAFDSALPRGEEVWTQVVPSAGRANALALAVLPNGQTVAVGSQDEAHLAHNGWLLHLASDGDLLREEVPEPCRATRKSASLRSETGDTVPIGGPKVRSIAEVTMGGRNALRRAAFFQGGT